MKLFITDTDFINEENAIGVYLPHLNEERIIKINRFKGHEDKKRSVAAGLLVERMCEDLGIQPDFITNGYGKPFLKGSRKFFNLSHSGRYAAIAYGDTEVGVDIQIRRVTKESMLSRFLNPYELEEMPQDIEDRVRRVNQFWSIKEAYIKMLGMGLAYDMRNCIIKPKLHQVIDTTDNYATAYYKDFCIDDEYFLTVCSREDNLPDDYVMIKVD